MKFVKIAVPLLLILVVFYSCQNTQNGQRKSPQLSTSAEIKDLRPKEQIQFLNKVGREFNENFTDDAIKKDSHIEAFNRYALDSLKKIIDWEMIVTEINDDDYYANSVAKVTLGNKPIYNLILVAPIKPNYSVDTIAIDNRVDFTYTLLKSPQSPGLKKQLSIIKTLTKGDTVIVSGAITHIDDNLKVNFASFYDRVYAVWNVDALITDIRKK